MANHKSAEKRARQAAKRTLRNKVATTKVRTLVKKLRVALEAKNKDEALTILPKAQAHLTKLGQQGTIKRNNASRKVSRLAKQVAQL